MTISISDVASLSENTTTATTNAGTDLDQEAFLSLLITQLQYQDPMNPQDSQEFVAQLSQFSSLEQLMEANDNLETLYLAMASMNNATMTHLIGKEVTAWGDTFSYDGDGSVTLNFDASTAADEATLNIMDEDGRVIHTVSLGALSSGEGEYEWNGTTTSGGTAEAGTYTFSVTATAGGESVTVDTLITGEVDGMSYETGTPVPQVDGIDITLADIIRVSNTDQG